MYLGVASQGFSAIKIIVAVIIIGLIAVAGYVGYDQYMSRQEAEVATTFANSFVSNIQQQHYTASYEQLNDTARQAAGSSAGWTAWVQSIQSAGVKIDQGPATVSRLADRTYTLFYHSSTEEGLSVVITKGDEGYSVTNYAIRNESDGIQ